MRATGPSTRRAQRGQAIVLIVLMLVILVGFLGLGIDGGRAYVDRREMQDSADAAALGAADNYINNDTYTGAESAAAYIFGADERTGGSVSWTGYGSTNAIATWSGSPGTTMTVSIVNNAFNGTAFYVTGSHPFPIAFMQTLGVPSQVTIGSAARSVVLSQSQTPALLTLSQAGCPGQTGQSLTLQGSASTAIIGALYANGTTFSQTSANTVTVAGNAFTHCGAISTNVILVCYDPLTNPPTSVTPTSPGVCPTGTILGQAYPSAATGGANPPPLADPNYTVPLPGLSLLGDPPSPSPTGNVELQPGIYSVDPKLPASTGCYFLDPGIYDWSGGFTASGGLFTNELRPPDEHVPGNLATRNNPNLFYGTGNNIQHCDGAFEPLAVYASADPVTNTVHGHHFGGGSPVTWSIFTTSLRTTDSFGGQTYVRESAPSMCRPVTLDGVDEGLQVVISNVPGAQAYNVYAALDGGACSGPFGYLGTVDNGVRSGFSVTNTATAGCPYLLPLPTVSPPNPFPSGPATNTACSLGYVVSQLFDAGDVSPVNGPVSGAPPYCPVQGGPSTWCQYPTASPLNNPAPNDGGEQLPPPPPAGAAAGPLVSPLRDIPTNGGGDRADENQCRTQGSGATAASPCSGATVTPGAVIFYFPTTGNCFSIQGPPANGSGDLYIFGGLQYHGITMYAPGTPTPGNTCTTKLAGGASTTIIGTIYMPAATLTVYGNSSTAISGQVIVGSAVIDGTSGTAISYNPGLSPPAPGARLIY